MDLHLIQIQMSSVSLRHDGGHVSVFLIDASSVATSCKNIPV